VPWLLLAAAYGLDQLTKALVVGNLSYGESWPEHGFLRITYVWNTGTAFSLFQDQGGPLTVFSLVAVFALYFIYRSLEAPNIWVRMAFGLLLGGAFGNLTDRLREGHVIDFIDVGPWPVFNIADSSIVVGIAVLFLYFWMNSDKSKKDRAEPGKPPVSGGPQDHPSGG
jgi:signal peptidase II